MKLSLGISTRFSARRLAAAVVTLLTLAAILPANAQVIRNYNVLRTTSAPTIDGVVSPGEWDAATPPADEWGLLRDIEGKLDAENNRFRMLWDNTNLYILYQTDFNQYLERDQFSDNPDMSFANDGLHWYFDPNTDGEPNFVAYPDDNVDGYQFSFNQYRNPSGGSLISRNSNRQGVGFYTEAHVNTPFGDQANWNKGGVPIEGAALQQIVVAQLNNSSGGIVEIMLPWSNFNADALAKILVDDVPTTVSSGLNRTTGPANGELWFFNVGRQGRDPNNGNWLPIWNWQPSQIFAAHPHGTITFVVPEPASWLVAALGAAACLRGLAQPRLRERRGEEDVR